MKAKEYLSQALRYKRRYENALEELEYIRSMATGLTAIRYDKDQVQTSPENDQLANYMIRLEKAEKRALKASEEYFKAHEVIRLQIEIISPQLYADVLHLRYIQGRRLYEIADELKYSYEWMRIIHGRALREFGKIFPEALKEETKTNNGMC